MTAEAAGGEVAEPLVWESFFWGLLSAISLNIGSAIGVTCLPRQRVRAVLMSFGGGALLFALSIELFGSVLHHSEEEQSTDAVLAMEGSAVVGGVFFAVLNHALNVLGADLRKPSTTKSRFARLRALLLRRLAVRLWKIQFFSVLTLEELKDLIQSAMYKERFVAGDIIMSGETSGIYFILSGLVRLQIFGTDKDKDKDLHSPLLLREPSSPKELTRKLSSMEAWDSAAKPQNSWDLGTNQIFGDMTVLTGSYFKAQAIALETTKVLVLPGHEVARLLEENAAVRDQISLRAVERLRQVAELRHLPDHALASLSTQCTLARHQPGDLVFHGAVDASTPVVCLVLGSIEFRYMDRSCRRTLHASRLLCTEHLKTGEQSKPFTLVAVEPSSVLIINRCDINAAMAHVEEKPLMLPKAAAFDTLPGQVSDSTVLCDVDDAPTPPATQKPSRSKEPPPPPHIPQDSLTHYRFQKPLRVQVRLGESQGAGGFGSLGHELGWDVPAGQEDVSLQNLARLNTMPMGQITDLELEEHQQDLVSQQPGQRSSSKQSQRSKVSFRVGRGEALPMQVDSPSSAQETSLHVEPHLSPNGCEEVPTELDGGHGHGHGQGHSMNPGRHRAVMIWLGILIDAVPESLVIGIIINQSAVGGDSSADRSSRAAAAALPFVIGVFLSNLPESMSSSGSMKQHGMRVSTIVLMWLTTTILTAVGACLGAVLFPPALSGDHAAELAVVSVEGLAAGAMLTMIAQTMMPEAFEQGGDIVGLSCLAGFLCALSVKLIPIGSH